MTRHAGGERRNAGEGGRLDRHVAVATIDAVVAHVMLMTERDGLQDGIAGGCIGTGSEAVDGEGNRQDHEGGHEAGA